MDKDQAWATIHQERRALAGILESLDDAGWDHPSLCAGWRVREVAAHVISSPQATPAVMARAAVRARGRFHRLTDDEARRLGSRPPAEILADYRRLDGSRRRPPGTRLLDPLLDVLVHTQDIAVPLGRRHDMPPDAARAALTHVWRIPALFFPARRALTGVRLVATDVDWTHGTGPVVEGPVAALLLLTTGRRDAALPTLAGAGVPSLTR